MAHRNVQGYRTILSRCECWQIRAIDHPDEQHKRCILKKGGNGNHLLNTPATLNQQPNHHNILQNTLHQVKWIFMEPLSLTSRVKTQNHPTIFTILFRLWLRYQLPYLFISHKTLGILTNALKTKAIHWNNWNTKCTKRNKCHMT